MILFIILLLFCFFSISNGSIDERFTCSNVSLLSPESGVARLSGGWNKEAHVARWLGKRYTIKRASSRRAKSVADAERKLSYSAGLLRRELSTLNTVHHWNLVTGYGGCDGGGDSDSADLNHSNDERVLVVTEFVDGYQFDEFVALLTPWCVQAQFLLHLSSLLRYFRDQHLMHCDWKADQFLIRRKDYRLVLVDLDAVYAGGGGAVRPLLAGESCSAGACSDLEPECFQVLVRSLASEGRVMPEAECQKGVCGGFSSASLFFASAELLLRPLLHQARSSSLFHGADRGRSTSDAFRASEQEATAQWRKHLARVIKKWTRDAPQDRASPNEIYRSTSTFMKKFNSDHCLTQWLWHERTTNENVIKQA